jgi:N-methylhydantoinase A
MRYFIGVDIGGTFTDCVAVGDDGTIHQSKSLSTKADPSDGVMAGLEALARAVGSSTEDLLASAERLAHGTTIGTNLVIERKGARVGLLTTVGHRDALLMMRGHGRVAGRAPTELFSLQDTDKPESLVPRGRIAEVSERVDAGGGVVVALDEAEARRAVESVLEGEELDAVAVSLLWSFRNPVHERILMETVEKIAPDTFVCTSSTVAPRLGEFERTAATVINAYVGPASTRYLDRAAKRLREAGLVRPLLIMQSNGGVLPVDLVKRTPLALIDSGPAGGLAGAATLARAYGQPNVIATDMGGTSFDVGLIVGGEPVVRDEGVIEQHTYYLPHLDVRSIACGGGTIARFDPHGESIAVGPDSAGSEPGPAAYGRGGKDATVTDADIVLGLIRPDAFLDGEMALDREAATEAVRRVAEPVGISVEEAAAGIIRINNNHAATLIRQQTLQRGFDTRDFALYAYGGAGAVHAFGYAPELGIDQVIVPLANGASTLSAYGMASSDVVQYFERDETFLGPFEPAVLGAAFDQLEQEARDSLASLGLPGEVELERVAMMRYAEQFMQSLPVAIDRDAVDGLGAGLQRDFEEEYARLFGEGAKLVFRSPEIFSLRVRASITLEASTLAVSEAAPREPVAESRLPSRDVYWPDEHAWVETAAIDGRLLQAGDAVPGPAVIELPHTTVAVAPGQAAHVDGLGSIVLSLSTQEAL